MERNICRPITFYNNFIPRVENETRIWEYCAFGTVDGIQVGDDIVCGREISVTECIWEEQQRFCKNLRGIYLAQQIYAVRWDDPEKEREFWNPAEEYAFWFFCRIQCDYHKTRMWANMRLLEKALQIKDRCRAMTFLTYDNSDMLIVLRAANYNIGAGVVNALHQKANLSMQADVECTVKNSFTIFAVRYDWLNNMSEETKARLNCDTVKNAVIRMIERKDGTISKVKEQLKNRIQGNSLCCESIIEDGPMLGVDDFWIRVRGIGWGDFLSLYGDQGGMFYSGNRVFSDNAAAVTTHIDCETVDVADVADVLKQEGMPFIRETDKTGKDPEKTDRWEKVYKDKIKGLCGLSNKIKAKPNKTGTGGIKEIEIILNTLPKFSGEMFNDYVFFPILDALATLLEFITEEDEYYERDPFYDFLKSFNMYAQSSLISDRHTAQMMNFDAKLYDIPIKLNAFYNAYLYKIKKILNRGNQTRYSFLIMPGMSDFVNVVEMYQRVSEEKRLMKVEIPEYSAYNLHDMMIILTHETAHYVGTRYRKRTERYFAVVKSYAHVYVRYVRNLWNGAAAPDKAADDGVWEEIERRAEKILLKRIQCEEDKEYIINEKADKMPSAQREKIAEKKSIYAKHFPSLSDSIRVSMEDIIRYGISNLYSPILYEMDENERENAVWKLERFSRLFMTFYPEGSTCIVSQTVLSSVGALYEECFADMMAVKILHMSLENYIDSLILNGKQQGMEQEMLESSEVIYRIMVVMIAVLRSEGDSAAMWQCELKNKPKSDWFHVAVKALKIWEECFGGCPKNAGEPYEDDILNILHDEAVIRNVVGYLLQCGAEFEKQETEVERETREVREVFQKCGALSGISVEEQIILMENLIENYKDSLLRDMEQGKEEM